MEVNKKTYSDKSFIIGLIAFILILITLATIIINKNQNSTISAFLIGLPLLISGLLGIIGLVYSIKGLKEKKTIKKIFGLIFNFGIIFLYVFLIIASILDVFKALK